METAELVCIDCKTSVNGTWSVGCIRVIVSQTTVGFILAFVTVFNAVTDELSVDATVALRALELVPQATPVLYTDTEIPCKAHTVAQKTRSPSRRRCNVLHNLVRQHN